MKNAVPQLYEAILEKVRKKITENQLTQAEIGKALGIKQSAVSYLLKGKTKLNLDQFLLLSALVGEKPHKLIADADSGLTEVRPMPRALEEVQMKSIVHLLAYVAACRPVRPEDLATSFFPLATVKEALDDLVRADLLELHGGRYQQKEVNVVYSASTKEGKDRRFQLHLDVHRLCQQIWLKQQDNKEYRSKRFNYFMMDYFTPSQVREVEEFLWRAYERLKFFQRENMANGFQSSEERYSLWHAHLTLMTPLEEK